MGLVLLKRGKTFRMCKRSSSACPCNKKVTALKQKASCTTSPHAPVNRQVCAPVFHLHRTPPYFKTWALPEKSLLEFQILHMQRSLTLRPTLNFLRFVRCVCECCPFSKFRSYPGTDVAHLLSTPCLQGLWVCFHTQKSQSGVLVYFCCNLFNLQTMMFLKERWKTWKKNPTCYVSPQD